MLIEFSDKFKHDLFKTYGLRSQEKLNEIGHEIQNQILAAVEEQTQPQNNPEGKALYLKRMNQLTAKVSEFVQVDATSASQGLTENILTTIKFDMLYIYRVQNLFAEYFIGYTDTLDAGEFSHNQNSPFYRDKVTTMLSALRIMLWQGTNVSYFGFVKHVMRALRLRAIAEDTGIEDRVAIWNNQRDLVELYEILLVKLQAQKAPYQMISGDQERWDLEFQKQVRNFEQYAHETIKHFLTLTQMILFKNTQASEEHMKVVLEQEGSESELSEKFRQIEDVFSLGKSHAEVEAFFTASAHCMTIILCQEFELVKEKKALIEQHVIPSKVVQNLLLIIQEPDQTTFSPKMAVSAIKVLQKLIILDLLPEFNYSNEKSNPFFQEACKYFNVYVSVAKQLSEFYQVTKYDKFMDSMQTGSMQVDQTSAQQMISTEDQAVTINTPIASQRFMKSFLTFIHSLVSFRSRTMQTQFYPQLVEPLVQIIGVMPRRNMYIINLDCQKNALQVLREITKSQTFDDSRQLEVLINRLKFEFDILKLDYEGQSNPWKVSHFDDNQYCILSLSKRQEFIGSCLRFLCYSIIRTDPNQISINQNFIAHSRKILESGLFNEHFANFVFAHNVPKSESTSQFEKVIDPIFLNCIQLFNYVFNDLPQKIGENISSGLLTKVVKSLEIRIPTQQDFPVIVTKFIKMLLLNEQLGRKLVIESNMIEKLHLTALDHHAKSEIVMTHQSDREFDLRAIFHGLACDSQEISDRMLAANIHNFRQLNLRAWDLTRDYLQMCKDNKDKPEKEVQEAKNVFQEKQIQFEKTLESAAAMLFYQVLDELEDMHVTAENYESNVKTSIKSNPEINEILKTIITNPTCCSAADNFLAFYSDTMNLIMMLQGPDVFIDFVKYMTDKLRNQLESLKRYLKVSWFDMFDITQLSALKTDPVLQLAETALPEHRAILFEQFELKGEDAFYVSIAKISAYIDVILTSETVSRQSSGTFHKAVTDWFIRPEMSQASESLKCDLFKLEILLRSHRDNAFAVKFNKRVQNSQQLINKHSELLSSVEWKEFSEVSTPFNESEESLNMFFLCKYGLVHSYEHEQRKSEHEKWRFATTPCEQEVPETSKCKSSIKSILSRFMQTFKSNKVQSQFDSSNKEIKAYGESNAVLAFEQLQYLADMCRKSLQEFDVESLQPGPNFDASQIIRIHLSIMHVFTEINQELLKGSLNRHLIGTFTLNKLLDMGQIDPVLMIIEWGVKTFSQIQERKGEKLLLFGKLMDTCIMTPVSFLFNLIQVSHVKKADNLRHWLAPDELNADIAIAKLKVRNINRLVYPITKFFFQRDQSGEFTYLRFADLYLPEVSKILAQIFKLFAMNALFGKGSMFDVEQAYIARFAYNQDKGIQTTKESQKPPTSQDLLHCKVNSDTKEQLLQMGFEENDVVDALQLNRNDFEKALDSITTGKLSDQRMAAGLLASSLEGVAAPPSQQDCGNQPMPEREKSAFEFDSNWDPTSQEQKKDDNQIDAEQILTSYTYEFNCSFRGILDIIKDAFVPAMLNHFQYTTLDDKCVIVSEFLLYVQILQKEKQNCDRALVDDYQTLVTAIFKELYAQKMSEDGQNEHEQAQDWLLIEICKFVIENDCKSLKDLMPVESVQNLLARLMKKQTEKLNQFVTAEISKDYNQDPAQRRLARFGGRNLFDIDSHIQIATLLCIDIKMGMDMEKISSLLATQDQSQNQQAQLNQLKSEWDELLKKQGQDKDTRQKISSAESDFEMQIDTNTNKSKQQAGFLIKDLVAAGESLSIYLEALIHFFKNLKEVTHSFHNLFGSFMCKTFLRAVQCLNAMASLGQVGNFDFRQAFIQKNVLRIMLQAKVIDKEFCSDGGNIWNTNKPGTLTFPSSTDCFMTKRDTRVSLRSLMKKLWLPQKELQRYYENSIKRQLFIQFKQNFKAGENMDLNEFLAAQSQSTNETIAREQKLQHQLKSDSKQKIGKDRSKTQQKALQNAMTRNADDQGKQSLSQLNLTRSKSEEKHQPQNAKKSISRQQKASQLQKTQEVPQLQMKLIKKIVTKYEDYNTAILEDFISYNNSACINTAFMQDNFSVFLAACAKVCLIKLSNDDKHKATTSIMLKRQILKELLVDPDYKLTGNYGPQVIMSGPTGTIQANKFHQETVNQLLEMFIEQTKGMKMDIMRILRNPIAHRKADDNPEEQRFAAGDTVLKISKDFTPSKNQLLSDQTDNKFKLMIDKESTSLQKFYFLDFTTILSILHECMLSNIPIHDMILKHNDSKTIKFILRNIFFLLSIQIEAAPSKQLFFDNTHISHFMNLKHSVAEHFKAEKIIMVVHFLNQLLLVHSSSPQVSQRAVTELQNLFVQETCKNMLKQRNNCSNSQMPGETSEFADNARLLVKYNSVWMLTQFLFCIKHNQPIKLPEETVNRLKIKIQDQQRAFLVKRLLVECQTARYETENAVPGPPNVESDLVMFKHLRIVLNQLEEAKYLFTKCKISCMHMCIWGVTSILKLFEDNQNLFIQIQGPPPPDSDDDNPKKKRRSKRLNPQSLEEHKRGDDVEMQGQEGNIAEQQNQDDQQQEESSIDDAIDEEELDDMDSDDNDEEEDDGDSDQSPNDDSSDFFQGGDDLSSNRENDDPYEISMNEHDDEDSDIDSWVDLDNYGSEESEEAIGLVPVHNLQAQSSRPVTKSQQPDDNDESESIGSGDYEDYDQEPSESLIMSPSQQPSISVSNVERIEEEESYGDEEQDDGSYEEPLSYNNDHESIMSLSLDGEQSWNGDQPADYHDNGDDIDENSEQDLEQYADQLMNPLSSRFQQQPNANLQFLQSMGNKTYAQLQIIDALEGKIKNRQQALQKFKEKILTSDKVFMQCISKSASNKQQALPDKNADVQSPEQKLERDGQGDEVVTLEKAILHEGVNKAAAQHDQGTKPQDEAKQVDQLRNQGSQRNPLTIEGVDPLFLDSLTPHSLQNIADSHQIQNEIVNSANRIGRATQILEDTLRMQRNLQSLHPGEGTNQLNMGGRNEVAAQTTEQRDRYMSFESLTYDLKGPNDQSRCIEGPQHQDSKQTDKQDQKTDLKPKTEPGEGGKVVMKGSKYLHNIFTFCQDMHLRFNQHRQTAFVDKQCQDLIQKTILSQGGETELETFMKIKDCVEMSLQGFKIFREGDKQIQSRIRMLYKIPNLRLCLIIKVLHMIISEIDGMQQHRNSCMQSRCHSAYICNQIMLFVDQHQPVQRQNPRLEKTTVGQTISVGLTILEQLQDSLQQLGFDINAQFYEITSIVATNTRLKAYTDLIIGNEAIDQNKTVLEILLDKLQSYFEMIKESPWLLTRESKDPEAQQAVQQNVLLLLTKILKPIQDHLRNKSKFSQSTQRQKLPVLQICEMMVAPQNMKSTKQSSQHAMKVLSEFNDRESLDKITNYLKMRLNATLKKASELLNTGRNSTDVKQKSLALMPLNDEVKELLKISSRVHRIKDENICNLDELRSLFDTANKILQEEQMATDSGNINDASDGLKPSNQLLYRSDIKELILLIFSLCEYNLKIIFHNHSLLEKRSTETQTLSQSPPKQAINQQAQEDSELNCQDQVSKLIEKHISKHVGESQADFSRFKSIITFFVQNKKLINLFIRVNQQVVNVQLKNLVLKVPQILEFDTKRLVWRVLLKKQKTKTKQAQWDIAVRRDSAFDDSFAIMQKAKPQEWKKNLRINFEEEAGVDEGGLTKEWFSLLSKQMFDENMALFLKSSAGSTYFPNPKSAVQPEHVEMFDFIGKFVGKALLEQQLLDCYFVKAFYKMILEMPLDYTDLEDYDLAFYKSLTQMLSNEGVENYCIYFVETEDYFGTNKDTELCKDGANKLVTDENKAEYVRLVANHRLDQAVKTQMQAFLKGLFMIIPKDFIKIFDNRELELLISGLVAVDIDDLRENTVYVGYSATSQPVQLLWQALKDFDNSDRAEFLQFVTGSSKVPVEGFKGLRGQTGLQKFTIAKIHSTDQNRLPQSHTCVNQLDLPQYKDKETTKRMILMAIKEGKTFGIA